jgi:hypothetical protein
VDRGLAAAVQRTIMFSYTLPAALLAIALLRCAGVQISQYAAFCKAKVPYFHSTDPLCPHLHSTAKLSPREAKMARCGCTSATVPVAPDAPVTMPFFSAAQKNSGDSAKTVEVIHTTCSREGMYNRLLCS